MKSEPGAGEIDTTVAHPARVYDFWLGGTDNFQVDREAGREMSRIVPEAPVMARANRAFLQRAVRTVIGELGVTQIIDIGTGLPTVGNVTEIARQDYPDTRIVCVDNDPIVYAQARALLSGTHARVAHVQADARDPQAILALPEVGALIDFDQPVALLLVAVMHFIADEYDPYGIVAALRDALAPGSYLVLSHATSDLHPVEKVKRAKAVYDGTTAPFVMRTHAQIEKFFDGWDLIPPGLVQVPLWRPDGAQPPVDALAKIGIYGGVGRRGVQA